MYSKRYSFYRIYY